MKQTRNKSQIAWYVIDDRKMYKPGEEVSLKGWLRAHRSTASNGDVNGLGGELLGDGASRTRCSMDSQGRQDRVRAKAPVISAVGGFDTKFTLPKTPNLGYA